MRRRQTVGPMSTRGPILRDLVITWATIAVVLVAIWAAVVMLAWASWRIASAAL